MEKDGFSTLFIELPDGDPRGTKLRGKNVMKGKTLHGSTEDWYDSLALDMKVVLDKRLGTTDNITKKIENADKIQKEMGTGKDWAKLDKKTQAKISKYVEKYKPKKEPVDPETMRKLRKKYRQPREEEPLSKDPKVAARQLKQRKINRDRRLKRQADKKGTKKGEPTKGDIQHYNATQYTADMKLYKSTDKGDDYHAWKDAKHRLEKYGHVRSPKKFEYKTTDDGVKIITSMPRSWNTGKGGSMLPYKHQHVRKTLAKNIDRNLTDMWENRNTDRKKKILYNRLAKMQFKFTTTDGKVRGVTRSYVKKAYDQSGGQFKNLSPTNKNIFRMTYVHDQMKQLKLFPVQDTSDFTYDLDKVSFEDQLDTLYDGYEQKRSKQGEADSMAVMSDKVLVRPEGKIVTPIRSTEILDDLIREFNKTECNGFRCRSWDENPYPFQHKDPEDQYGKAVGLRIGEDDAKQEKLKQIAQYLGSKFGGVNPSLLASQVAGHLPAIASRETITPDEAHFVWDFVADDREKLDVLHDVGISDNKLGKLRWRKIPRPMRAKIMSIEAFEQLVMKHKKLPSYSAPMQAIASLVNKKFGHKKTSERSDGKSPETRSNAAKKAWLTRQRNAKGEKPKEAPKPKPYDGKRTIKDVMQSYYDQRKENERTGSRGGMMMGIEPKDPDREYDTDGIGLGLSPDLISNEPKPKFNVELPEDLMQTGKSYLAKGDNANKMDAHNAYQMMASAFNKKYGTYEKIINDQYEYGKSKKHILEINTSMQVQDHYDPLSEKYDFKPEWRFRLTLHKRQINRRTEDEWLSIGGMEGKIKDLRTMQERGLKSILKQRDEEIKKSKYGYWDGSIASIGRKIVSEDRSWVGFKAGEIADELEKALNKIKNLKAKENLRTIETPLTPEQASARTKKAWLSRLHGQIDLTTKEKLSYTEAMKGYTKFTQSTKLGNYSFNPKTGNGFDAFDKKGAIKFWKENSNGKDPVYVVGITNHQGDLDRETESAYEQILGENNNPLIGHWKSDDTGFDYTDISFSFNHGKDDNDARNLAKKYEQESVLKVTKDGIASFVEQEPREAEIRQYPNTFADHFTNEYFTIDQIVLGLKTAFLNYDSMPDDIHDCVNREMKKRTLSNIEEFLKKNLVEVPLTAQQRSDRTKKAWLKRNKSIADLHELRDLAKQVGDDGEYNWLEELTRTSSVFDKPNFDVHDKNSIHGAISNEEDLEEFNKAKERFLAVVKTDGEIKKKYEEVKKRAARLNANLKERHEKADMFFRGTTYQELDTYKRSGKLSDKISRAGHTHNPHYNFKSLTMDVDELSESAYGMKGLLIEFNGDSVRKLGSKPVMYNPEPTPFLSERASVEFNEKNKVEMIDQPNALRFAYEQEVRIPKGDVPKINKVHIAMESIGTGAFLHDIGADEIYEEWKNDGFPSSYTTAYWDEHKEKIKKLFMAKYPFLNDVEIHGGGGKWSKLWSRQDRRVRK